LTDATWADKGILVHSESLPAPAAYGTVQSCTAGVPWPNQAFYYGLVALDERGNRSPVSNLISVYIAEATTTTTAPTTTVAAAGGLAAYPDISPADLLSYLQRQRQLEAANESGQLAANPLLREQLLLRGLTENLVDLKAATGGGGSSSSEIYIAAGVVSGIVIVIIILLIVLVMLNRRKRSLGPLHLPSQQSTSSVATVSSSYSGRGPEDKMTSTSAGHLSKLSTDGSSKVLLSWLDSLPKTGTTPPPPPPPPTAKTTTILDVDTSNGKVSIGVSSPSPPSSHNTSMESGTLVNTISRRNHTLTRTNPYRHKVLTNGSFVSLKDIPSGGSSDEGGSTRLTASTLDDSNGSDTSSGGGGGGRNNNNNSSSNNIGLTSKSLRDANNSNNVAVRRSNTSAATLRQQEVGGGGGGGTSLGAAAAVVTTPNNTLRRSHNTGYYSFRDYSPVFATATLGRGGQYRNHLPALTEDNNSHGTLRHAASHHQGRKTKRTESFV
jgi:hypothetical protein